MLNASALTVNTTHVVNGSHARPTEACAAYVYDTSQYRSTVVTQVRIGSALGENNIYVTCALMMNMNRNCTHIKTHAHTHTHTNIIYVIFGTTILKPRPHLAEYIFRLFTIEIYSAIANNLKLFGMIKCNM